MSDGQLFKQTHDEMRAAGAQLGSNADDSDANVAHLVGVGETLATCGMTGPAGLQAHQKLMEFQQINVQMSHMSRDRGKGMCDFATSGADAAQHGAGLIANIQAC